MGLIYSRVNFLLATSIAFTFSTCLTLSIGYLSRLWVLLTIFVLNGMCLGFFEAGSNVFILHLWGKETAVFMQALHFMFGSGSLIAPLIAEPFLVKRNETLIKEGIAVYDQATKLFYPYSVIAVLLAINAVVMFVVYRLFPETEEHHSRKRRREEEESNKRQQEQQQVTQLQVQEDEKRVKSYKRWKVFVLVLTLFFMHIYLGLEISFGSFLMTFAVNSSLKLSKATGAHLTTLFWSTFTFIRVLTILVIGWAGNRGVILTSLTLVLSANALLTPFGDSNQLLLWLGVGMIGIGMSSVWACIFGYLEEFFPVTSVIGSLMIVSAVLGEFVFPVIISSFVKDFPQILLWVVLFCSVSIALLFSVICLVCEYKLKRR